MSITHSAASVIRPVIFTLTLATATSVGAQGVIQPLLSGARAAPAAKLPNEAKPGAAVIGHLDSLTLKAPKLKVTLPDGSTATALSQHVARNTGQRAETWVGTFEDEPGSALVLTNVSGVVTGLVNYRDTTFELRPTAEGAHVLFEIDESRIPQRDGVEGETRLAADALTTPDAYGADGSSTLAATSLVVQDVLVVYTAKASNQWGRSILEGMIHNAVQSANQAYGNSRVGVSLNLVGLQQVAVTESSSGMQATLNMLIQDSTVRSLRDRYAADMVVLVVEDPSYCGWATLTIAGGNADAYAVVWSSCLSNQSLAHEVGHLQGLDHNRENGGNGGFYPYGYGYRVCKTGGFRDVMSYACPSISVPRILNYSNPDVYYNGYATGISYETSPSTSADTARSLNNSATTVANYRVGTATMPAAPSALAATATRYDRVGVSWTDNSYNETGFKVERSGDGVTYSLIATLGTDTRTFTDFSVAQQKAYYYRVRAYNSAGASAYSNVLSVKTPGAPPAAPGNVAAVNGGNGTATITWADKSTNETRFEIRRRKWDAVARTWGSFTTVGTVGANVTRYVNTSGRGTFRYHVRAANTYGASSWVGPAQVTVTGG